MDLANKLEQLTIKENDPNLWQDQAVMQNIATDKKSVVAQLDSYDNLKNNYKDTCDLLKIAELENDQESVACFNQELIKLHKKATNLRAASFLSKEADKNDCFIEINAGAGGRESQDWVMMLQRMYIKWAENQNSKHKVEIVDVLAGDGGGFKSTTIKICGMFSYGWLKSESGVHRLVRISPFDSNSRRHTSFASVWVSPCSNDDVEILIEDKDLRIDTYRASGAGGQHVNKTDSAVRITHIPSGIITQCQNDRSQHRNKATAMSVLKSKLYELELQKRNEAKNLTESVKKSIEWGNQIRSYVLQPYQMVKDLRTNVEIGDANSVLAGNINQFLEASLMLINE